ncbi:MAG: hypothetical protein R3315_01450, partial [Woeseiaceae bacterium]|nr:hypothetical protein [Woeseiaceae bacterium]
YYAVANDRAGSARTDIFFVDVQPFDRRYTQSQMAGGGGGQGAGQNEISQRQREIIVSTWNLIREQQEKRRDDVLYVPDNAALLARLQQTLREQAMTLAQRTRARMLTVSDENIAEFVDNLEKAAEAMVPAATLLADVELEDAILPEQEALQHLLRAEAVFNDINVSMQANRGGGGGQAGRDLTDMFELEMDLEKNQYETGSRATPDAPEQQLDDIGNELEELARRQEQLANRMNRDRQPTPAQRWQQDLLRRETEELRERLERMQQSNQQQSARNQQGSASASGEAQQGQPSETSPGEPGQQQRRMDELRRRLDSALRAMNDADQAMRDGADPQSSQQAAAEAQRQLEGARDEAAAERERLAQAALDELGERAEAAHRTQAAMEERLQRAIREVLADNDNVDRLDSGLSFTEEMTMARQKRELQTELQRLEQDAKRAADDLSETDPRAAEELERALGELRDGEVDTRLAIAANYIEIGEAVYVSGSESSVTEALREFAQAMRRAGQLVAEDSGEAGGERGLEATLADTQALRRQLQELANGAAGGRESGPMRSGRDDRRESTGVAVADLDVARDPGVDFDNLSDDILNQFRALREAGVPVRELDDLRRLASEIRASDFSGNDALLEREATAALALIEQLELALARALRTRTAAVRATPAEPVTDEHREPVAQYFRRLGEAGDEEPN